MAVMCHTCEKLFSTQSTLNRHIREVHQKVTEPVSYGRDSKYNSRCMEPNCDNAFTNNKGLMGHLQNIHLMKFETESHFMDNMNGLLKLLLTNISTYLPTGVTKFKYLYQFLYLQQFSAPL